MIKKLLVLFFVVGLISVQMITPASARSNSNSTYVHGYTKHSGAYIHGYHRTIANHTYRDNYSHKGNYNPWTHKYGTNKY